MSDQPAFIPAPRKSTRGWTPETQARFLAHLAATGSVTAACAAVGLSRTSAYQLRAAQGAASFAQAWDEAVDKGIAALKAAAFDRALVPQEEPVYHAGQFIGTRPRQNNQLLMRLLTHYDRAETQNASPFAASLKAYETAEILARFQAIRRHPSDHKLTATEWQHKREASAVAEYRRQVGNLGFATSLREWLEEDSLLYRIERLERGAFENAMVAASIREIADNPHAVQPLGDVTPLKDLILAVRTEAAAKAGLIRLPS